MMVIVFSLFFGAVIGSFLNVVIDRVPQEQSLVTPPSHCPSCNTRIRRRDLIPIFSYLHLRGRCQSCGSRIPIRVLIVEIASAVTPPMILATQGVTPVAFFTVACALVLLVLSVIDLEHGIVPPIIVLPITVAAVPAVMLLPPAEWKSALLGAAVTTGLLLLPALLRAGAIGWGDVKLAPFLGLASGYPQAFLAILSAFIMGGIIATTLLALHIVGRKTPIPFVPFLAAGTLVAMLWGKPIVHWYSGIF
ncbi:MAG: prepilin peptidase [Chloroflexi bacterium]|nr:prepilin peptidase [Chloroflexota bacterium]